MDYINKLAELLNVAEITEDWKGSPALEVGPWHTADGYKMMYIIMTLDLKILLIELKVVQMMSPVKLLYIYLILILIYLSMK